MSAGTSSRGAPIFVNAKLSPEPSAGSVVVSTSASNMFGMDEKSFLVLVYCSLLALQFGLQPMLASKFTPPGVAKSSVVIATEICKIFISAVSCLTSSSTEMEKLRESWSLRDSLTVAALPATLYAIQNLCVQYGYVLLDSMTFNLLNQTKTLSAALWLYLIMGQPQSIVQIFALLLLLIAAILLNLGPAGSDNGAADLVSYNFGLLAVAAASMLSGLSAALTQRTLTGAKPRPSMFLSAEMAVYGIVFLLVNLYFNNDIKGGGYNLFQGWQWSLMIPVLSNAFGGIVVGQVTKLAGGVVKGFALIAGIVLTGIANWIIDGKPLGLKDLVAVVLVSVSIFLHSSFPPVKKSCSI